MQRATIKASWMCLQVTTLLISLAPPAPLSPSRLVALCVQSTTEPGLLLLLLRRRLQLSRSGASTSALVWWYQRVVRRVDCNGVLPRHRSP